MTDYTTETRFLIQSGPGSKTITGEQREYLKKPWHQEEKKQAGPHLIFEKRS
jgi:hypothetical protein